MEKKNNVIDGKLLDLCARNTYFYGKGDPDSPDISSDELAGIYLKAKPKFIPKIIGKVFIFGTGGDTNKENFENLFKQI